MNKSFRIALLLSPLTMLWQMGIQAQPGTLPSGEFRKLVQVKCTSCHMAGQVASQRGTASQWSQIVESMILRGAEVSDTEFDQIVSYLTFHFGPEDENTETKKLTDTSEKSK